VYLIKWAYSTSPTCELKEAYSTSPTCELKETYSTSPTCELKEAYCTSPTYELNENTLSRIADVLFTYFPSKFRRERCGFCNVKDHTKTWSSYQSVTFLYVAESMSAHKETNGSTLWGQGTKMLCQIATLRSESKGLLNCSLLVRTHRKNKKLGISDLLRVMRDFA
jgi:hypothetical protein